MRRGLAGLILGLALVVASVSWAGFIMTRTVLDPGRSERLADQLFENAELRGVLASRLASSISGTLPGSVVVPDSSLRDAADLALDNPAVQGLVQQAIVDTHRNALEGNVQPVVIDGEALATALRSSLIEIRPELDGTVPPAPAVSIELPTSGLNFLGTIRSFVERTTMITAAIALLGALVSMAITSDRPSVLRRVAFWAFGAAVFWLVVGFGIPWIAAAIGPASAAIVTAVIDVFFGAMIRPAIIMGMVGGVLLALSYFWRALSIRRPANVAQPARAARGTGHKVRIGQMSNISPPTSHDPMDTAVPTAQPVDATVVQPSPMTQPAPSVSPGPTAQPLPGVWEPAADVPAEAPAYTPLGSQVPPIAPAPEPQWVEGVGYVVPETAGTEDEAPPVPGTTRPPGAEQPPSA